MRRPNQRVIRESACNAAITATFLALVMVLGVVDLRAQTIAPQTPQTLPEIAYKFIGVWSRHEDVRGDCGTYKDSSGKPLTNCSVDVTKLPMNDRARAWLNYMDELQSPSLNDCAAITVINLIGDVRPFGISFKTDSVVINYEHANIIRPIWMDGRRHPPPTDLYYQGHSIGHWEGNVLVVDTANFAFDPDGMDDHLHFPGSTRKRVIERYSLLPDDMMKIEATIEDPVFLTKPFVATHTWKKTDVPMVGWWECDPEITHREMEATSPVKYKN